MRNLPLPLRWECKDSGWYGISRPSDFASVVSNTNPLFHTRAIQPLMDGVPSRPKLFRGTVIDKRKPALCAVIPPAVVLTDKTLLQISRVPINKPEEPERIVAE